jgi:acetyltransferase-like isoleucine patch superfamily enzyme
MRALVLVVVFLAPPFLKKFLLRRLLGARIGRGVRIGWFSAIACRRLTMGDYSEVRAFTLMRCDGDVQLGQYSIISSFVLVYGSASLLIGNHCYVGPQSLINVDEDVRIGNLSAIGPRGMIFTHGSFLPYTEGYWARLAGVTIGDRVWIAAGVFIHPGVKVGDNVFVNSRSVLTAEVPSNQVVEGYPAAKVTEMQRLKRNMTPPRVDAAAAHMLKQFVEIVLRRRLHLDVQDDSANGIVFRYRFREYLVACIPSEGPVLDLEQGHRRRRVILLVNRPGWEPPRLAAPLVFDLAAMRTELVRDKIHRELWKFMRMYFGVTFEFEMCGTEPSGANGLLFDTTKCQPVNSSLACP